LSGSCECEFFRKSMQLKILLKQILLTIFLTAFAVFLLFTFYSNSKSSTQNKLTALITNTLAFNEQEKTRFSLPVRLKIPKINVEATVEYVGLTSDGAMDVPKNPDNVAWFSLGSRPGEVGSAVMAGHSGWKDGQPTVFDGLYKLDIGDKIYVENEEGIVATFVVRKIRTYDPLADASSVFSSSDGKVHLNLITCVGFWDEVSRTSSNRLVVFTDKEEK